MYLRLYLLRTNFTGEVKVFTYLQILKYVNLSQVKNSLKRFIKRYSRQGLEKSWSLTKELSVKKVPDPTPLTPTRPLLSARNVNNT